MLATFFWKVRFTVWLMFLRSMLSTILPQLEGFEGEKNPLTTELRKGFTTRDHHSQATTILGDLNQLTSYLSSQVRERMPLKGLAVGPLYYGRWQLLFKRRNGRRLFGVQFALQQARCHGACRSPGRRSILALRRLEIKGSEIVRFVQ